MKRYFEDRIPDTRKIQLLGISHRPSLSSDAQLSQIINIRPKFKI